MDHPFDHPEMGSITPAIIYSITPSIRLLPLRSPLLRSPHTPLVPDFDRWARSGSPLRSNPEHRPSVYQTDGWPEPGKTHRQPARLDRVRGRGVLDELAAWCACSVRLEALHVLRPHRAIEADALRFQCFACDAGLVLFSREALGKQPRCSRPRTCFWRWAGRVAWSATGLVTRCCGPRSARFSLQVIDFASEKTGVGWGVPPVCALAVVSTSSPSHAARLCFQIPMVLRYHIPIGIGVFDHFTYFGYCVYIGRAYSVHSTGLRGGEPWLLQH